MKKVLAFMVAFATAGTASAVTPGTELFVPGLAHSGGFGTAQWRGDVWVFNPSAAQSASVTVYLLLRQPNPNPTSMVVTIQPGETRYFPDIIGTGLFQQTDAAGGLRFLSSTPVLVTARSYDANVTTSRGTGTSGQFMPGIPSDLAVGAGDTTDIIGLDQSASADPGTLRSNLSLVEATGNTVNFVLDRLDSNGAPVGSWACDGTNGSCQPLGPWEVRQFNLVLGNFSPNTGANQRIRIRVTGGSGRIIAAASRIDNTTGDPSTIDMSSFHRSGRFEGVVLDAATGSSVEGGLQLAIRGGVLTSYRGLASIPCGSDVFTVDFSPSGGSTAAIGPEGTFSTSVSIPYGDGASTLFTTNWTIAGARDADGKWSGTLKSTTTGGHLVGGYDYSSCNASGVNRLWRAAWTANP
jgi:hypothetical protein